MKPSDLLQIIRGDETMIVACSSEEEHKHWIKPNMGGEVGPASTMA